MTALPAWIDPEAWEGFVTFRQRQEKQSRGKIAWTARAEKLIIVELYKLRDKGHDPNASLDQSTLKGWTDVFPAKDKEIPNMNRVYNTSKQEPMTEAEKVSSSEAKRAALGALQGKLRRVA